MKNDSKGQPITKGATCRYNPDPMDNMFGNIPDRYEGDICTVTDAIPYKLGVSITFESDQRTYRCAAESLTVIAPAVQAPAADAKPKGDAE